MADWQHAARKAQHRAGAQAGARVGAMDGEVIPPGAKTFQEFWNAPDFDAKLARLNKLEWFLESSFTLPVLGRKSGMDAIIGLIPGVGDIITGAMGSYIILEAVHAGMPKHKIARMVWNLGFDTVTGSVPVIGDLFDFFYSANTKNLKMLKAHIHEKKAGK